MKEFLKGGVGALPLHVGGQVGRMQPQITWALGCMGEKGTTEKSCTCEGMSTSELCRTELRARVRLGK